jgi:hypothetical protein
MSHPIGGQNASFNQVYSEDLVESVLSGELGAFDTYCDIEV